jgi:Zn-dependent peptidase ImmA (M78 family)
MNKEKIINLAIEIKNRYGNKNITKICKLLEIKISEVHFRPEVSPAYTIRSGNKPLICLNSHYTEKSKNILCAHELGHVLLHDTKLSNHFNGSNDIEEYEANLFAVALLFNEDDLCISILSMNNYMLKALLEHNLHLK